jgi:hypothetical protein
VRPPTPGIANGLVERRSYPAAPPRVEYRLSPLGQSLVDGPMRELGRWILEYGDELLDAQDPQGAEFGAAAVGGPDRRRSREQRSVPPPR